MGYFVVDAVYLLQSNEEIDGKIADHVLLTHRYRNPGEEDGAG